MEPLFILSVFLAGVLMFLAPCTLPLLPAYIGFISGVTQESLADASVAKSVRKKVFRNALAFVLGFTIVFSVMGILAGIAGVLVAPARGVLGIAGGIIIILFGLFLLGALKLPFLARERRIHVPEVLRLGTPASAGLLGMAFAFGWTPCIGPILGTVLYFASGTETLLSGAFLLMVFSFGFAVPFLLLALVIGRAAVLVERAAPFLNAISKLGGVVLILLGLYLVIGDSVLTNWFFELFEYLDFEESLLPYL